MTFVANLGLRAPARPAAAAWGVLLLSLWVGPAAAQPLPVPGAGYAIERVSETYSGCPGSVTNLSTGDGGGVKGEFDVNLPFSFRHYDDDFTSVTVVGAGTLAFPSGQTVSINNAALGTPSSPNSLVAVWWEDIELLSSNNGFLGHSLTGNAPNRQFCIEWNNFNDEQVNGALINFKVVLHEGQAGRIDVVYGPTSGSTGSYTATMGMEDSAGARPLDFNQPACSPSCQNSDLVAMANTRVTVTRDAGIEVFAQSVTPPQLVFLGAPLSLPIAVGSLHGNPIGPFDVAVSVADNPQMNGAVLAGTRSLVLGPFQVLETEVEVVPPASLAAGPAYFELLVDSSSELAEIDEDNNRLVSARTRLLPGAPDLSIESVRVHRTQVSTGQPLEVSTVVRNVGSVDVAGGQVAIMLSTNPAVSRFDTQLDSFTVDLGPGATETATVTITLPVELSSGAYYIGALADPAGALDELDEINNALAFFEPIEVSGTGLAVATTRLPSAPRFLPYFGLLAATGGVPPFSWELTSGTLPAGIGLVPETGQLYGRPSDVESQTFTVRVTDAAASTASAELTLAVVDPETPLTIVSRQLPATVVGQEYVFGLTITGAAEGAELEWSAEALPAGIALQQGYLTGTPTEVGTFDFTVTVSSEGATASRDLQLEVEASSRLLIHPEPLSTARVDEAYQQTLEASGGQPPYVWSIDSGELPSGLRLDPSGDLTGTPTEVGTFRFVVRVSDSGARPTLDRNGAVLEVSDDGALTITTTELPDVTVGVVYEASISAAGGRPPYLWTIEEGRLPDGLFAEPSDQLVELSIVGQVDTEASHNVLVQVVDATGRRARRAFGVNAVEPEAAPPPEEPGCTCAALGGADPRSLAVLGLLLWGWSRRRRGG